MHKIILSFVFILIFAASAAAQCDTVEDCRAKLSTASQAVNKLLDLTKAQEQAIEALKAENAARQRKTEVDAAIIAQQDKLIELLEKRTRRQVSLMFGLLKIRY